MSSSKSPVHSRPSSRSNAKKLEKDQESILGDEKDDEILQRVVRSAQRKGPPSDVDSDQEWDTDLEDEKYPYIRNVRYIPEEEKTRIVYMAACSKFKVVPSNSFFKGLSKGIIQVNYQGLGPIGTKALALGLVVNRNVTELHLAGNMIGEEGIRYITAMMAENEFIKLLDLSENDLGAIGAEMIMDMFNENDTLSLLNLSGNHFKEKDAERFAEILQNPHEQFISLRELDLSHNEFADEGAKIIGHALGKNDCLTKLSLKWNHIRSDGFTCIADGLTMNAFLRHLDLSWNGMGNSGAKAISKVLEVNRTLEELNLNSNRIGTEGVAAIFKAISNNQALKILRMSNNPIPLEGPVVALEILKTSDNCGLKELEIQDLSVPKKFLEYLEEILVTKPHFKVHYGGFMDFRDLLKVSIKKSQDAWMKDPILLFLHFVEENQLNLMKIFTSFDTDKSCTVSKTEFIHGLQKLGIPMTEQQLDEMIIVLDIDKNGEIDPDEFMEGYNKHMKRLRKYLIGDSSRSESTLSSADSRPASSINSDSNKESYQRSEENSGNLLQVPVRPGTSNRQASQPTVQEEPLDLTILVPS
ncbi:hypothetical protein CHS0354_029415 [Potamilus streckersoni]|uniref:EF-hand domain-containing protein n=1 Tax=Potamilus streckersoni TaxID=2493646 RepID=A0AAE0SU70_9BIVA|nr:hypothetical protein CHS0354_029415 [Potamilus streckersoni]